MRAGLDAWHAQGRGQGGDRLRLPHDHDGGRPRPLEDMAALVRRRRHVVQDVHGLPGRVPRRRSADLPRDAARRRARRADHDARRDRPADRRAGRSTRSPRATPRRSITRSRAPRSPRRRHRARDRARRDGEGARVHGAPVGAARARAGDGGARPRPARVRARPARSICSAPRTICAAPGLRRVRATCARRRCGRSTTTITCGAACATTTSRSSRPTTARSA